MSGNPFNSLEHPEGHPIEGRLVSKETVEVQVGSTKETKPVIEVQPNGSTLKLAFIRSNPPAHPFKTLIKQFLCYATEKGYTKVALEDDAMFTNPEDKTCVYRALMYRLFQGKNSLYVDQGFHPTTNVSEEKERLLAVTVKQMKEITPHLPESLASQLTSAPDEILFRTWILEQPCLTVREFINKIDFAAGKLKATTNIGPHGRQYLEDWKKYIRAHQDLQREPVCSKGGGRLRSRTRTSSGRKHKRRVTRKDRRHRKGSKKA
jgi:hypothetical protein